jgi:glycosyltransferase involved in cell wall biosynthesis
MAEIAILPTQKFLDFPRNDMVQLSKKVASRELPWRLLVHDIAQYRQSLLGSFWAFIPPIITAADFTFATSQGIISIGNTELPYTAYVMFSILLWQSLIEALNGPVQAVTAAKSRLFKINFPREVLIVGKLGEVFFNFGIKLILIVGLFIWFKILVNLSLILVPLALKVVSVIIPTYNRADLICHTLDSAINQSYKNLEIIVIDDGSTDNTEEVVKDIGDERIRYIRHPSNLGGSIARNTGIEAATGEYIAFLDSDDLWAPEKIQLQLASIQKHPHPQKVVCHAQIVFSFTRLSNYNQVAINSETLHIVPERGKGEVETIAEYLFCHHGELHTSSLMMHRSLALATRFRPDLKRHQDWDFCFRLEDQGAIFTFIKKPLVIWNDDPRQDRISRMSDYQISVSWIREYQSSISSRATTGFVLTQVLPLLIKKGEKLYAEKIILDALRHRLISLKEFKKLTFSAWEIWGIRNRLNLMLKNIFFLAVII